MLQNLATTGTKNEAAEGRQVIVREADRVPATLQKSEELPAPSQSPGAEDGLWSALSLGRCSGRGLSCGAGPSAPAAPRPVPAVGLTSGESHLAGF